MACASCKQKPPSPGLTTATSPYPFMASDIKVIEGSHIRAFQADDWQNSQYKLLILLPQIFTPTCTDQIKGMARWYTEFQALNCELILLMTDPVVGMQEWFASEELLHERPYKAFSSYLLPSRLGMLEQGRARRGAVFVTPQGTVIRQDAFPQVAPSFRELHRILWAHTTGDFCGSDWQDPSDALTA